MPSKRVNAVIQFCDAHQVEIVSYGLAPNPNGFCYELFGDACSDEGNALNEMLERLTRAEVNELRALLFGGKL